MGLIVCRWCISQSSRSSADKPPALGELPSVPFLNEQGVISDAGVKPGVKASVYAVMDAEGVVQYIGVSRNVMQSLRLQLGRMPDKTYAFKVRPQA